MYSSDDDSPLDLGDDLFDDSLLLESTADESVKTNLKICFENDDQPDEMITLVKMETDQLKGVREQTVIDQSAIQPVVQFDPGPLDKFSKKKSYKNHAGEFETEIDLKSTDSFHQRKERVKRFGEAAQDGVDTNFDTDQLFRSLAVEEDDSNIRFNTILLRGVNEMATADIFKYFNKFPPRNLEWIDDTVCIAVYSDPTSAYRALLHLSKPIKQCLSAKKVKIKSKPKPTPEPMEDDDYIDLNDDIDTSNFISTLEKAIGIPEEPEAMESESEDEELYEKAVDLKTDEIPPGAWRLAEQHPESTSLFLLRFATKDDVKVRGAEQKSEYSKKYDNPSHGGLQGVISKSRKFKIKEAKEKALELEARMAVQGRRAIKYEADDLFGGIYEEESEPTLPPRPKRSDKSSHNAESNIHKSRQETEEDKEFEAEVNELLGAVAKRRPGMKMHADVEEERVKSRRLETRAWMDKMDVRKRIDRAQSEKSFLLYERNIQEQSKPDLRSRLKRPNQ